MNCYEMTKWNTPSCYACESTFWGMQKFGYSSSEDERVEHDLRERVMFDVEKVYQSMDDMDKEILCRITCSRFLTPEQLMVYLQMQGLELDMVQLDQRITKLDRDRVIKTGYIWQKSTDRRPYLEIDVIGNMLARNMGVDFHAGIRYYSYAYRVKTGMKDFTAADIERVLMANQILLSLLKHHAGMQRFGFQELLRVTNSCDKFSAHCILRTNLKVDIDEESVLLYEVVRETEGMERLAEKLERYYQLLSNPYYLISNLHADKAFPQLVICGENIAHNRRIYKYLSENGMIHNSFSLLFTEDRFYMGECDPLSALYEITESGALIWYALPKSDMTRVQTPA